MFIFYKDIIFEDFGNGVICCILVYDGKMMVVEVNFVVGVVGLMYNYFYEQFIYVFFGEFEFIIGEEMCVVSVGDMLYKWLGIMYGCVCLQFGMLFDIFIFICEDFFEG